MHRKAAVLAASRQAERTPPGSEKGACVHRGNSGTCESHMFPCEGEGPGSRLSGEIPGPRQGSPTPAKGAAASSRGIQTENGRARYRGDSEERRNRDEHMAVLAEHSSDGAAGKSAAPGRRGSATRATRRSEGEAGHNVPPEGTTGGTPRPLPVSPKPRWSAEQSRQSWLRGSIVMRQDLIRVLITDEPDELIAHVRICGGGGPVTAASTRNLTDREARSAGYAESVRLF